MFGRKVLSNVVVATALLAPMAAVATNPNPSGDMITANSFERPATSGGSGGSNYHWFDLGTGCNFEPYGLVANYHLNIAGGGSVRARAQQQLASMRSAGMQRLSLGIFFAHANRSGTLIDSSNPTAVAQAVQNIQNLLADAKTAGFIEVLFRFFPTSTINPSQPNFDPNLVNEYWNLIVAVRPALVNAGIAYRIDLMAEGAPRDSNPPLPDPWKYPDNPDWSRAVRALWQNYFAAYGKADSVGFSFLADNDVNKMRYRVRHMRYVYEGNYPYLYAADFYDLGGLNEAEKFISMNNAMFLEDPTGSLGWRDSGWILSEVYYDDPLAAANLSSARASTRRKVFYLTQWPLDRANTACGVDVNVAPPYSWLIYRGYGY